MSRGLRRFICRAFWLEPDQPAAYYKDALLGAGFIVSVIVAFFSLTGRTSHPAFWLSVVFAAGSLAAATNKLGIVAGAFFFGAIRFGVAFAFTQNVAALLVAAVLCLTGFAILKKSSR